MIAAGARSRPATSIDSPGLAPRRSPNDLDRESVSAKLAFHSDQRLRQRRIGRLRAKQDHGGWGRVTRQRIEQNRETEGQASARAFHDPLPSCDGPRRGRVGFSRVLSEVRLGDGARALGTKSALSGHHLPAERLGREGSVGSLRQVFVVKGDGARGIGVLLDAPEQERRFRRGHGAGKSTALSHERAAGDALVPRVPSRIGEQRQLLTAALGQRRVQTVLSGVVNDGLEVAIRQTLGPVEMRAGARNDTFGAGGRSPIPLLHMLRGRGWKQPLRLRVRRRVG